MAHTACLDGVNLVSLVINFMTAFLFVLVGFCFESNPHGNGSPQQIAWQAFVPRVLAIYL